MCLQQRTAIVTFWWKSMSSTIIYLDSCAPYNAMPSVAIYLAPPPSNCSLCIFCLRITVWSLAVQYPPSTMTTTKKEALYRIGHQIRHGSWQVHRLTTPLLSCPFCSNILSHAACSLPSSNCLVVRSIVERYHWRATSCLITSIVQYRITECTSAFKAACSRKASSRKMRRPAYDRQSVLSAGLPYSPAIIVVGGGIASELAASSSVAADRSSASSSS